MMRKCLVFGSGIFLSMAVQAEDCYRLWLQDLPAGTTVTLRVDNNNAEQDYEQGACLAEQATTFDLQVQVPNYPPYEKSDIELDQENLSLSVLPEIMRLIQMVPTGQGDQGIPISEMQFIRGGTYQMGCQENDDACFIWNKEDGVEVEIEKPLHEVTVPNFYLGKTEVTFAQYDVFCDQTNREKPDDEGWGRGNRSVINVSWNDAQAYIQWLNQQTGGRYRLPTEAEWEYAARAGTTTKYYWGDEPSGEYANGGSKAAWESVGAGDRWDEQKEQFGDRWQAWPDDSSLNTTPVASYQANAWGLYDMSGNVWEWVEDRWHDNYKDAPTDGSAWLNGESNSRVLRGGSWSNYASELRSGYRNFNTPDERFIYFGFRLAQDAPL